MIQYTTKKTVEASDKDAVKVSPPAGSPPIGANAAAVSGPAKPASASKPAKADGPPSAAK